MCASAGSHTCVSNSSIHVETYVIFLHSAAKSVPQRAKTHLAWMQLVVLIVLGSFQWSLQQVTAAIRHYYSHHDSVTCTIMV